MKKYFSIFEYEVMNSLQYTFNLISRFISYSIMIFIFVNLWTYIYSDPNEIINGYSMNQMIWYVIFTEILWMSTGSRSLTANISNEVKEGNVAYRITKPYNYINYQLFAFLGSIAIKFILFFIYGMLLGFLFMGEFPIFNPLALIVILITAIISIMVNALFSISIGLASFVIEDSAPLYWVYSKFILILGTIFPVEYFPEILAKVLKYSPIFAICYGPARLFVNFSWGLAIEVLIVQIIYLIIIYLITQFIFKKGVKKLNVNGG